MKLRKKSKLMYEDSALEIKRNYDRLKAEIEQTDLDHKRRSSRYHK